MNVDGVKWTIPFHFSICVVTLQPNLGLFEGQSRLLNLKLLLVLYIQLTLKSPFTFCQPCIPNLSIHYVGADSIIQVGSDSILLCSVIYKFVNINTFNCGTIACI